MRPSFIIPNSLAESACIYAQDMLNFISMITLLVVTSDDTFGELLRQSLEETGRFNVFVTNDNDKALEYVRDKGCPLAFLDTSMPGKKVLEIGAVLRQANPEIRYIIISEAGWHPALEEITPIKYLAKPFYLPDLMEMMDDLFGKLHPNTEPAPIPRTETDLNWLADVNRAAQHLTRLTLETSAQAALITRNETLWSYAGQLPQEAARELADAVARYWDSQKEKDLLRFIRLAATDAEHMLYATRLGSEMVLALIFDAETPFSLIRTQASQLVRSLEILPSEIPAGRQAEDMPEVPMEMPDEDEDMPQASIADILSDVPEPNPEITDSPSPWKEPNPAVPFSFGRSLRFTRDILPSRSRSSSAEETKITPEELEKTIETSAITRKNRHHKSDASDLEASATHPNPAMEKANKIRLEPVSAAVYNLDYACMLIPRFPHHHLTGDLSEQLSEWVPQACVSYGWRLEYIAIRPEYLLWIANVTPATAPGYLMRMLRIHTNERIFEEFPRFRHDNPSGDFWAAGYFVMGSSQPPAAQLLKDYIFQTRSRQGFNH
jgi:CheY-like chemotaxis protein/REP element-mobilizing transposase RayT